MDIQYSIFSKLFLLAFKKEQRLEVWKETENGEKVFIRSYPFTATTGTPGPKLKEGDKQIPEGIYSVEYLNPKSKYHLSFKLNYPNDFDKAMAEQEGRTDPGGDIFIHGGAETAGCIAIGDEAIEEVYAMVAKMGKENVTVMIFPQDGRLPGAWEMPGDSPLWLANLYEILSAQLKSFQK